MSDKTKSTEGMQHDAAFEKWWREEGIGLPLRPNEDFDTYGRRVARVAWLVGAQKAIEILQQMK
jgi:hypothetical protein